MKLKLKILIFTITSTLTTTSCITIEKSDAFIFTAKTSKGTISIVSATDRDKDIYLANLIAKKLTKTGRMQVQSREEMEKRLGTYPANFINTNADREADSWGRKPGEMNQVNLMIMKQMSAKLRTDHLLIVWIGDFGTAQETRYLAKNYAMNLNTRLYSRREGKITGYSDFDVRNSSIIGSSGNKAFMTMLEKGSEQIVKEFIEKQKGAKK